MEYLTNVFNFVISHPENLWFLPVLFAALILLFQILRHPENVFNGLKELTGTFFIEMPGVKAEIKDALISSRLDALTAAVERISLELRGQDQDEDSSINSSPGAAEPQLIKIVEEISEFSDWVPSTAPLLHQLITAKLQTLYGTPIADLKLEELYAMRSSAAIEENRWREQRRLETVFRKQLESAGAVRRAMTNLFVLVNLLLIAGIFFKPEQILSNREIILGLYISFATFIVYVYRSSNSRALILMAGMEDSKRYHDAEKYLSSLGKRNLNERDVDVLKLLMINRMEREKNSEHPYELVLKGISNSNILVKGGKIATTENKDK